MKKLIAVIACALIASSTMGATLTWVTQGLTGGGAPPSLEKPLDPANGFDGSPIDVWNEYWVALFTADVGAELDNLWNAPLVTAPIHVVGDAGDLLGGTSPGGEFATLITFPSGTLNGSDLYTALLSQNPATITPSTTYAWLVIDDAFSVVGDLPPPNQPYSGQYEVGPSGSAVGGGGDWNVKVVPEPSTFALLGLGLVAMIYRRKRG